MAASNKPGKGGGGKKRSASKRSAAKKPGGQSATTKKRTRKAAPKRAKRTSRSRTRNGLDAVQKAGKKTWKTLKKTTARVVEGVRDTLGR